MKYTLIIKPEAESDTLKSAKWYEEKQEGLGLKFLSKVEEKLQLIIKNPLHYQVRYLNTRFGILKDFPYAIHFIVEAHNVVVLAVLGTRDDPNKWN